VRTVSPARSATWWSTRTGRSARAANGAAGSGSRPEGGSAGWASGDADAVHGEHVTTAAAEGDAEAQTVLVELAWWVALGLANLANIFDPQAFVLGGGLIKAGEPLLSPVRTAFAGLLASSAHRPPIAIVPATLGEHAGAIGAACLFDLVRNGETA